MSRGRGYRSNAVVGGVDAIPLEASRRRGNKSIIKTINHAEKEDERRKPCRIQAFWSRLLNKNNTSSESVEARDKFPFVGDHTTPAVAVAATTTTTTNSLESSEAFRSSAKSSQSAKDDDDITTTMSMLDVVRNNAARWLSVNSLSTSYLQRENDKQQSASSRLHHQQNNGSVRGLWASLVTHTSVLSSMLAWRGTQTRRRCSSALYWAMQRRLSSCLGRIDNVNIYIATTPTGIRLEQVFMPLLPPSTEALGAFLGIFALGLTLPNVVSRWHYGKWKMHYPIQWVVNAVCKLLGWSEPLPAHLLEYATDAGNPTRPGIDQAFFLHAVCGLTWALSGSLQIANLKRWNRKFHRRFGYFALAVFACHFWAGVHVLYRDIVKHKAMVKALLLSDMVSSSCYLTAGILKAQQGDIEGHQDMMMWGFLHAIEGSGTIRFTAYLLWLWAQPFSHKIQTTFVTSICQGQYPDADAGQCVFPYTFRLQAMRLLTLYFYGLYLRTPEKIKDGSSRHDLGKAVYENVIFIAVVTAFIFVVFELEKFDTVRDLLSSGDGVQMGLVTVYTAFNIYNRSQIVRRFLVMPRRNAARESTATRAQVVAIWAKEHKID